MKTQNRMKKIWRRGDQQSRLKHLDVNIKKILVMFWVEVLQDMVHFVIVNWFNQSYIHIWNRFIGKFNCKLLRVDLNITIINCVMIKSLHYIWNHRAGVGRRYTGFEGSCWGFSLSHTLGFMWVLAMNYIELVHLSYKTWLEEFRATYDAGISLVSNTPTSLSNTFMSNAAICKNWMERLCIIIDGIWSTKMMWLLTWSGQCYWGSNHLHINIQLMFPLM